MPNGEEKGLTAEIKSIEKRYMDAVIAAMEHVNASSKRAKESKQLRQGVWYPTDYQAWCAELGDPNSKHSDLEFYADDEFWEVKRGVFRIKPGKKPSAALRAFLNHFTKADCGSVLIACQYAALLELFGDDKFDALFPDLCIFLSYDNPYGFFYDHLEELEEKTQSEDSIGLHYYKPGVKGYDQKHPGGVFSGLHIVSARMKDGKKRLIGFQFDGTEEELTTLMVDDYNRERNDLDRLRNKFFYLYSYPDQVTITSKEDIPKIMNGPMRRHARPNFSTIAKYMEMDVSLLNLENRFKNILQGGKEEFNRLCKFIGIYPRFARVEYLTGYVDKWNLDDKQFNQLLERIPQYNDEKLKLIELFKDQHPVNIETLLKIYREVKSCDKVMHLMWGKLRTIINTKEDFEQFITNVKLGNRLDDLLVLFKDKLTGWLTPKVLYKIYCVFYQNDKNLRIFLKDLGIKSFEECISDWPSLRSFFPRFIQTCLERKEFGFLRMLSDEKLVAIINTKDVFESALKMLAYGHHDKHELIERMLRYQKGREIVLEAVTTNPRFYDVYFENDKYHDNPLETEKIVMSIKKMLDDIPEAKATNPQMPQSTTPPLSEAKVSQLLAESMGKGILEVQVAELPVQAKSSILPLSASKISQLLAESMGKEILEVQIAELPVKAQSSIGQSHSQPKENLTTVPVKGQELEGISVCSCVIL